MRVRFAPSPTGHLHVGNARTAIFNWLLARGQGGVFILRVEDTDFERSTREFEQKILDDLRWLGLQWDEGVDAGGSYGPYRQSERLHLYSEHAGRLVAENTAYYCFCTAEKLEAERQAQLAAGQPPKYSGTCRALPVAETARRRSAGDPAVIRLRVPQDRAITFDDLVRGPVTFHTSVIGDPILVRSDGIPAYNFAVVIDDALMAVTHVIRGEDHISNTPRQVLLYEAFGWTPPQFAHLSLVLGPDHAPLSKRHGATSVAEFRARGYLPEALFNYLALVGSKHGGSKHEGSKHEGSKHEGSKHEGSKHEGSKHEGSKHEGSKHEGSKHGGSKHGGSKDEGSAGDEIVPALEMARRFRLEDVSHSPGVFDEDKLAWVNRHYLKSLPAARLVGEALPFLRERGQVVGEVDDAGRSWLGMVVPDAAASVDTLAQVPDRLHAVFSFDAASILADPELAGELTQPAARSVVEALARVLQSSPRLTDRETFRAAAARVRDETGQKGRALFHPIRAALTGAAQGPELDVIVPAIDRGADLPVSSGVARILGCRERALAVSGQLAGARAEK